MSVTRYTRLVADAMRERPREEPTPLWTLECAVRKANRGTLDADDLYLALSRMEEGGRIERVRVEAPVRTGVVARVAYRFAEGRR